MSAAISAADGAVTWDRLSLQGFGRFSGPVSVSLQAGANVLVAPNEHGKSTLLAGLAAVLFGLDGGADPAKFTEGRFRSWDGGGPFRGELVFSVGGATYSVWRDFAERQATLVMHKGDGYERMAGGKHHATARRGAAAFEDALADLIGIRSRELFADTFYLRQPLPEAGGLDVALQRLLSGTGADFEAALAYLESQLRELTRFTVRLGVTTADARQDRRLEKVQAEISELRANSAAQAERIDTLQRLTVELSRRRVAEAAASAELAAARGLEDAWRAWLRHRSERDSAARALIGLQQTAARAEEAATAVRAAEALMREYPEYHQLPPGAGELLARLRRVIQEQADLSARQAQLRAVELDLTSRCDATRHELAREEATAGRPSLIADFDRMVELTATIERLQRRAAQLTEQLQGIDSQLEQAGSPPWEQLGPRPAARLERLQVNAAWLISAWLDVSEAIAGLQEAHSSIAQRYAEFAGLTEEQAAAAQTASDLRAAGGGRSAAAGLAGGLAGGLLGFLIASQMPDAGFAAYGAAAGALIGCVAAWHFHRRAALAAAARRTADKLAGWRAVVAEADKMHERIAADLSELDLAGFAGDPNMLTDLSLPAAGAWAELAAVAGLCGLQVNSAGQLIDWLAGLPDDWWQTAAATAAAREELLAARQSAVDELRRIGMADVHDGRGELHEATTQLEALRALLPGLAAATPRDAVLELQQRHRAARERLSGMEAQLGGCRAELARAAEEGARLAAEGQTLRSALSPLLEAIASGALGAAEERLTAAVDAAKRLDTARLHLAGILSGQGIDSVESLQGLVVQRGSELAAVAHVWDQLVAANPALPPPAAASDMNLIQAHNSAVTERVRSLQEELHALTAEVRDLERETARLEGAGGTVNLAGAESRLAELKAEEQELLIDVKSLAKAHRELKAAVDEFQAAHREGLAAAAGAEFDHLSAQRSRRVVLDDGFRVSVGLRGGRNILPAQLSQGARDQLYVALRIAIADLLAGRVSLPMLFDDPFLTFDPDRLGRMRATFERLAGSGRQLWLLTHRPEFAVWGAKVELESLAEWPAWEAE